MSKSPRHSQTQPVSYMYEATRVLNRSGITPKNRQQFLQYIGKILSCSTSAEQEKFCITLSNAEAEAWIRSFQLISKYIADSVDTSDDENQFRVSAKKRIQNLIDSSKSPDKSFSNRVSNFITEKRSPNSKEEVSFGKMFALSENGNENENKSLTECEEEEEEDEEEVHLPNKTGKAIQTQSPSRSPPHESSPKFINLDVLPEHDDIYTQTQSRDDVKTQTSQTPQSNRKKYTTHSAQTQRSPQNSQTPKSDHSTQKSQSPQSSRSPQSPQSSHSTQSPHSSRSPPQSPQSPHSPRSVNDMPSYVNLNLSSSSDILTTDPKTKMIIVNVDKFKANRKQTKTKNSNKKQSPPKKTSNSPPNKRADSTPNKGLETADHKQPTPSSVNKRKESPPKEQTSLPPSNNKKTSPQPPHAQKQPQQEIKKKIVKREKKVVQKKKPASTNNKISPIKSQQNNAPNVSPLTPENRPASFIEINKVTKNDTNKANSPPSPRLLELSKPRKPKLPLKEDFSDDFIVDEVISAGEDTDNTEE